MLPGNTWDKQILAEFLARIEGQYGKAEGIWIMDRGIPNEENFGLMRASHPPVRYLVGTPKGPLTKLEASFLDMPWEKVREGVTGKLLEKDGEIYVLGSSAGRGAKETAMRQRRLRRSCDRLREVQVQAPKRDQLLLKLGAAKKEAGPPTGWSISDCQDPKKRSRPGPSLALST